MQTIERDHLAMASLRHRIALIEESNGDLLAFARGHAGAVSAIHEAVLALLPASNLDSFVAIVTRDWPCLLGVDSVALGWSTGERALTADARGHRACEARLISRMAGANHAVTTRAVDQGHPLFGNDRNMIRAEIIIRLEGARGLGLLLLGQRSGEAIGNAASTRLLRFLGRTCATMLERWPPR